METTKRDQHINPLSRLYQFLRDYSRFNTFFLGFAFPMEHFNAALKIERGSLRLGYQLSDKSTRMYLSSEKYLLSPLQRLFLERIIRDVITYASHSPMRRNRGQYKYRREPSTG